MGAYNTTFPFKMHWKYRYCIGIFYKPNWSPFSRCIHFRTDACAFDSIFTNIFYVHKSTTVIICPWSNRKAKLQFHAEFICFISFLTNLFDKIWSISRWDIVSMNWLLPFNILTSHNSVGSTTNFVITSFTEALFRGNFHLLLVG